MNSLMHNVNKSISDTIIKLINNNVINRQAKPSYSNRSLIPTIMQTLNIQVGDHATICSKWVNFIAEMESKNNDLSQTKTAKRIRHCLENPCPTNRYYIESKTYINFNNKNKNSFNPYTYNKKRRSSTFVLIMINYSDNG